MDMGNKSVITFKKISENFNYKDHRQEKVLVTYNFVS